MTTTIPEPVGLPDQHPCGPIFHREGEAQVSYEPGHDVAELRFYIAGWVAPVECTERQWRELVAAVSLALADPLAESRRTVRRMGHVSRGGGLR